MKNDVNCGNTPLAFEKIDHETWKIRGSVSLDEVAQKLDSLLPVENHDTFGGFGGFAFSCYGFIPDDGSEFEIDSDSLHIKVTEIKEHRIEEAIISFNSKIKKTT